MRFGIYKQTWFCRWDGKQYRPKKETDRDGFCSPACKQAHHRAYKKYQVAALRQKNDRRGPRQKTKSIRNAKKAKKKTR